MKKEFYVKDTVSHFREDNNSNVLINVLYANFVEPWLKKGTSGSFEYKILKVKVGGTAFGDVFYLKPKQITTKEQNNDKSNKNCFHSV